MPNVSALDIYRNQFGMYEIVGADDPFPYAVIRVGLDGTPEEVKEAKNAISVLNLIMIVLYFND